MKFELNVEASEPGGNTRSFYGTSFQPSHAQQAIDYGGVLAAQALSTGGGVVVAVLDTGADASHPALAGAIVPGWNFVTDSADTCEAQRGTDSNNNGIADELYGHGTFVAGIVRPVAPSASIMPVVVLDSDGRSTSFRITRGIYYAVDQGASVINMSLGTPLTNFFLEDAIDEARAARIVVVASAGNEGAIDPLQYPAAYSGDGTIAVAGTDSVGVRAPFSSYGDHVSLSALGIDVVSAFPLGTYRVAEGTSFSAPWVSGAAALLKSIRPAAASEVVESALRAGADPIDPVNPLFEGLLGEGLLNVEASAALFADPPCPGDVDFDGSVNLTDFVEFLEAWSQGDGVADITSADGCDPATGDFAVDLSDFGCFLTLWALGCR